MSLFDTDMTGPRRSSPSPNAPDRAVQTPALNTISTSYASSGVSTNTTRVQMKNNDISGYDSTNTRRIYIGDDTVTSKGEQVVNNEFTDNTLPNWTAVTGTTISQVSFNGGYGMNMAATAGPSAIYLLDNNINLLHTYTISFKAQGTNGTICTFYDGGGNSLNTTMNGSVQSISATFTVWTSNVMTYFTIDFGGASGTIGSVYLVDNGRTGDMKIKVSKSGYDALEAEGDQLFLSSDFNMYKIAMGGHFSSHPMNTSSITLSGNNIGYSYVIVVDVFGYLKGATLGSIYGDYWVNAADMYGRRVDRDGVWYDDGTNKVDYKITSLCLNFLVICYNFRLRAGSYTFEPNVDLTKAGMPQFWHLVNNTQAINHGMGGFTTNDGKYFYKDVVIYNADGTINTGLTSSTVQFTNGSSNYYPNWETQWLSEIYEG